MIIRVFQVTTHPGKEREFSNFFHNTAIPLMQRTEGLHDVTFGTARSESPADFCMVMVWESLAALKAFAGEDYANPHILPEEAILVRARSVKHYDLVDA
ncbi:antibiotic biosynthesis monooxygenase family protein [Roseovarius aestuarii]|uniref:Antibiotic biosynthesis monooxygenase n=1 Tax=Roseovarius aestuarii TaxID=475083 RepID=A0A1X7BPE5_9RHOB|nr:antibiotic biosynthesis monooxygenase [Roseovarius aestuarii]SMC11517.1 Antibiotic biosynthesis monooxygenase [Roseovarius aestuarii]